MLFERFYQPSEFFKRKITVLVLRALAMVSKSGSENEYFTFGVVLFGFFVLPFYGILHTIFQDLE